MTNLIARKIAGAVLGAVAVALIYSWFGYSDDGATASDYFLEIALALASYVPAAFLMRWLIDGDSIFLDIAGIALTGSALSSLMKLIVLEGQNGIPAYIARSTQAHSWQPYGDLVRDAVSVTIVATLLSAPFVAIGGSSLGGPLAEKMRTS